MSDNDELIVARRSEIQEMISESVADALSEALPKVIREANQPEWVGPEKAREILGREGRPVTPQTLNNYRRRGVIDFRRAGRSFEYRRESLIRFKQGGRVYE